MEENMQPFLKKVLDDVWDQMDGNISNTCFVFPTIRAGLYFKKYLGEKITKPIWLPQIFAMNDFIQLLSGRKSTDEVTLIFELYSIYNKYFKEETLDQFYPWAEILLSDFDDIDANKASAAAIFHHLQEIKEIDDKFGLDEDSELIKTFWKNFYKENPGLLRRAFIDNWQHLYKMFEEFKDVLDKKSLSYSGYSIASITKSSIESFLKGYDKIVLAGFYYLSKGEESIFQSILDSGKGNIYFDTDVYYTSDVNQEAGIFIRKNLLVPHNLKFASNLLATTSKEITSIGVPKYITQVKYAIECVNELIGSGEKADDIAIVLSDESLLVPLLFSLPETIAEVNITMGYPLKSAPFLKLIKVLHQLKESARMVEGVLYFNSSWLLQFLESKYLGINLTGLDKFKRQLVSKRIIQCPFSAVREQFGNHWVVELLNKLSSTPISIIVSKLFSTLLSEDFSQLNSWQREFLFQCVNRLNNLALAIEDHATLVDDELWIKIYDSVVRNAKIPFTGEPLRGLQIIGFLETRNLDFKHLIMLSVNEDKLPAAAKHSSFIPYAVRKYYKLPTFEDQHAIAAYHFYRLLQRASNVKLIYSLPGESGMMKQGVSRFLLQIKHELSKLNSAIKFDEKIISIPFKLSDNLGITINKTGEVLTALNKYVTSTDHVAKPFSISKINIYNTCKLKFYFEAIAQLRPVEELLESVKPVEMGSIIHSALENILPAGTSCNRKYIQAILPRVDSEIDAAIYKHLGYSSSNSPGEVIHTKDIIQSMIANYLNYLMAQPPFKIKSTEDKFLLPLTLHDGRKVSFTGVIDRVDDLINQDRILDYKTGSVSLHDIPLESEELPAFYSNPQHSYSFQLAVYASALYKLNKVKLPVEIGIVTLAKFSKTAIVLNKDTGFTKEMADGTLEFLDQNIIEILNPEIPFTQVEDAAACKMCDFNQICKR